MSDEIQQPTSRVQAGEFIAPVLNKQGLGLESELGILMCDEKRHAPRGGAMSPLPWTILVDPSWLRWSSESRSVFGGRFSE